MDDIYEGCRRMFQRGIRFLLEVVLDSCLQQSLVPITCTFASDAYLPGSVTAVSAAIDLPCEFGTADPPTSGPLFVVREDHPSEKGQISARPFRDSSGVNLPGLRLVTVTIPVSVRISLSNRSVVGLHGTIINSAVVFASTKVSDTSAIAVARNRLEIFDFCTIVNDKGLVTGVKVEVVGRSIIEPVALVETELSDAHLCWVPPPCVGGTSRGCSKCRCGTNVPKAFFDPTEKPRRN